jgi:hypothetical protein
MIKASETQRHTTPDLFEKLFTHGVQVVGFGFAPTTTTEFLEALNRTVERDMAKAGQQKTPPDGMGRGFSGECVNALT